MGEALKKITVNVPAKTLEKAMRISKKGITETVIEGLLELERRADRSALRRLKGKIDFDLDLEQTRR